MKFSGELTNKMLKFQPLKSATALVATLSIGGVALTPIIAPIAIPAPAVAQTNSNTTFNDVPNNYWAAPFIRSLVDRGIIAGFPNGTFQPNEPVTRAQFAAMLKNAFEMQAVREGTNFRDVASDYWARPAIQEAYRMGFVSGYPNNIFNPNQNIPKEQVLTALANGLNYEASGEVEEILNYYSDEERISNFATAPIAAATQQNLVVNYPNLRELNPKENATRAEVAAMLYQALVSEGMAGRVSSPYVVNPTSAEVATNYRIPSGTTLPLAYDKEKILVTGEEIVALRLNVAANVTTSDGTLLIPAGSEIVGELRPVTGGTQFVAQSLVFPNGRTISIQATSPVVTETEVVQQETDTGTLLQDAALGTAAAAAIAAVTGERSFRPTDILANVGTGTLANIVQRFLGRNEVELLAIDPDTDLDVTLNSDLIVPEQVSAEETVEVQ